MEEVLVLRGGQVLVEPGLLRTADVVLRGGRVDEVLPGGSTGRTSTAGGTVRDVDVAGLTVVPGYLDLQVNGAHGVDLTRSPEDLPAVADALTRHGVTGFLPTLVSHPSGTVPRAVRALRLPLPPGAARPLGWHVEGPFLAPARRGAHRLEHLRAPAADEAASWSPDGGVRMVTLAPELPEALDLVRVLAGRGVVVSLGHTEATADQVRAAVDAGARAVTHLFNAMPGLGHRTPGPVGAALADDRVVCGLIPDGLHVDPLVLGLAWRLLGPRRWLTVTDTTAALGCPPGPSRLGDAEIVVDATSVRLPDGTLAGSVLALDEAVVRLVRLVGVDPLDAVATVTAVPARLLGLPARDAVRPGLRDLTLLDEGLRCAGTVVDGVLRLREPERRLRG
ncbi:MAG TPA: N-acetylglucosamine-6-phosphate deacetylase [Motilibacteraceae bacterium]|nr:N-acetylglucosamine-6-phosphate deacetylase [Motilibacteraceae bacterium]